MEQIMLVVGTQGAALQLFSFLKDTFSEELIFWDSVHTQNHLYGYKVMHQHHELASYLAQNPNYIIAVGNPYKRATIYKQFSALGAKISSFRCSTAQISDIVNVYEKGTIFSHNCY